MKTCRKNKVADCVCQIETKYLNCHWIESGYLSNVYFSLYIVTISLAFFIHVA